MLLVVAVYPLVMFSLVWYEPVHCLCIISGLLLLLGREVWIRRESQKRCGTGIRCKTQQLQVIACCHQSDLYHFCLPPDLHSLLHRFLSTRLIILYNWDRVSLCNKTHNVIELTNVLLDPHLCCLNDGEVIHMSVACSHFSSQTWTIPHLQ